MGVDVSPPARLADRYPAAMTAPRMPTPSRSRASGTVTNERRIVLIAGSAALRRDELGAFTVAQVGFADTPFAFELVPLEMMQDNPDGLDLATPSICFHVDDLEAAFGSRVTVLPWRPGDDLG